MSRPYEANRNSGTRRPAADHISNRSRSRSRSRSGSSSDDDDNATYRNRSERRDQRPPTELVAPAPPSFPKNAFTFKTKFNETRLPQQSTVQTTSRFQSASSAKVLPVHMKLATKTEPIKKLSVASAFSNDSDDEVEEMPAECRMRMRNIGRDTPTSSGPNSFGKTKQGFCDAKKMFEKNLNEHPGANNRN